MSTNLKLIIAQFSIELTMTTKLKELPPQCWIETSSQPFLIAGPCSAETREQILTIAKDLSEIPQVQYLRAGIWKPRTRPGGFEGMGHKALHWLMDAKQKYGIKSCVEVATPRHVEACLEHEIDAVWVGARTTGNPFSVQDLANALRGSKIPVMVKNPMNPDLKLWIGALERFQDAGIEKLAAIHRGFHVYQDDYYRNNPMWELPIELKRQLPNIPIICDPSHIGGKRELIQPISQMAMNLGFEGLIIETHPRPNEARTDAEQQITPVELQAILNELIIARNAEKLDIEEQIQNLRISIDELDKQMLQLLSKRMDLSKELIKHKQSHQMGILQMKRWEELLNARMSLAKEYHLNPDFIKKLMEQIHVESIRIQNEFLDKNSPKK